jgi:hypothetical protein
LSTSDIIVEYSVEASNSRGNTSTAIDYAMAAFGPDAGTSIRLHSNYRYSIAVSKRKEPVLKDRRFGYICICGPGIASYSSNGRL